MKFISLFLLLEIVLDKGKTFYLYNLIMANKDGTQRNSFTWYSSFTETIDLLPLENQLNAYKFIINYWIRWIEPDKTADNIAFAIFSMAKPQIDANNRRYMNGCKWWRPQKNWKNSKKP